MRALNRRLDSWKEIAHYLGRGLSTVRRWEEEKALPVHRVPGAGRQGVFAFTDEIDGWLVEHAEEAGAVLPEPGANLLRMTASGGPVVVSSVQPAPDHESLAKPVPVAVPRAPRPATPGWFLWGISVAGLAVVAAAILYSWLAGSPSAPRVLKYNQITNDGQPKAAPLVTDGVRLYFNEGTSEASIISQVPLAGGRPAPISGSSGLEIQDISPDGAELIVKRATPGATTRSESPLWLLPAAGGSLRSLGVSARAAAWSRERQRIAYAQGTTLYTIRADGSDRRRLADLAGVSWIRWSPDGSRLSVSADEPDGASMWQVPVGAGTPQRILPSRRSRESWMQNWTPDGRYLLLCRWTDATSDLWALGAGGRAEANPDRRLYGLTSGPLYLSSPLASRDNRKLFALGRLPRGELLQYNPKSGEFTPWLAGVSADGVAFSPDGKSVVYSLWPERTLWRSASDGSERLELTASSLEALVPRWSPDGRDIVFMARVRGGRGRWNIYRVPAEGGNAEALLPAGENRASPSWAPDGQHLAFSGATWMNGFSEDATALQVLDLRTRQVAKMAGSEGLWAAKWSPDGRHLVAEKADSEEIMLHDFQTGQWKSLVKIGEQAIIGYVCWSHAGDAVYFNTAGKPGLSIYRIGLEDQKLELVANLKEVHLTQNVGEWFGLAPDDSPLVLRDSSIEEIYALDVELP